MVIRVSATTRARTTAARHVVARPSNGIHTNGNHSTTQASTVKASTGVHTENISDIEKQPNKLTLANGLTLVTQRMPGTKSTAITILVKAGPIIESPKNNGISHATEHMAFKGVEGTINKSALEVSRLTDEIGGCTGAINAGTCREYTTYDADVPNRHVYKALELLLNMVFYPSLQDFETEKGVLIEEIRGRGLEDYTIDLLYQTIWKDHPLGKSILGKEGFIKGLDKRSIVSFRGKHYTPENVIISIAGDFDIFKAMRQVTRFPLQEYKKQNLRETPEAEFCPGIATERTKKIKLTQTGLALAFPGVDMTNPDMYIQELVDIALTTANSSSLYQAVREKGGFAYTLKSESESHNSNGLIGVYTEIDSRNLGTVLNLILDKLREVRDQGFDKAVIGTAKRNLLNGREQQSEIPLNVANDNAIDEYFFGRVVSREEVGDRINEITKEDVDRFITEKIVPDNYAIATVSPKKGLRGQITSTFVPYKE